jgi:hypothetical protein
VCGAKSGKPRYCLIFDGRSSVDRVREWSVLIGAYVVFVSLLVPFGLLPGRVFFGIRFNHKAIGDANPVNVVQFPTAEDAKK